MHEAAADPEAASYKEPWNIPVGLSSSSATSANTPYDNAKDESLRLLLSRQFFKAILGILNVNKNVIFS